MDLAERIERRLHSRSGSQLVVNLDQLNPSVHVEEPVGRESLFEALLDGFTPLLNGGEPANVHLYGPPGSGKSAVATALSSALRTVLTEQRRTIYTSTRAPTPGPNVAVAYVNARYHPSRFQLFQQFLTAVSPDPVPDRGVSTGELRDRLVAELDRYEYALVVVDHLLEPGTPSVAELDEFLAPLPDVCWLTVSRDPLSADQVARPVTSIEVPAYEYGLVDVLMNRGNAALSTGLSHETAKDVAEWSGGNAHHALAALFGAAVTATTAGDSRLTPRAVRAGKAYVPDPCVSLDRVLALPSNKQAVLTTMLRLEYDAVSVKTLSEEISSRTSLSQTTVHRYLYELAGAGILERREFDGGEPTVGRRPSRLVGHFPTLVYKSLREDRD